MQRGSQDREPFVDRLRFPMRRVTLIELTSGETTISIKLAPALRIEVGGKTLEPATPEDRRAAAESIAAASGMPEAEAHVLLQMAERLARPNEGVRSAVYGPG